jgi:gamma-glutamylcyclotransferase (GGCT)/AIG2-like uncharacterized protein YtfP
MDPQRVEALTGKRFVRVEAILTGFERCESRLGYPYILPKCGSVVHGVLLTHIDPHSLYQLDTYEAEGDLYRRQAVEVLVAGVSVLAMTYVGQAICALAQEDTARTNDVDPTQSGHDVMPSDCCQGGLS